MTGRAHEPSGPAFGSGQQPWPRRQVGPASRRGQPPLPSAGPELPQPLYGRVLRLRHLRLSSLVCFLLLEGMLAVGVLLALTELVSWWAVPLLPAVVAVMVKLNDMVAGASGLAPRLAGGAVESGNTPATIAGPEPATTAGPGIPAQPPTRTVRQVSRDLTDTLDPVDSPRQRFRQSARRRYR